MTLNAAINAEAFLSDEAAADYWVGEHLEEELLSGIIVRLIHSCSE